MKTVYIASDHAGFSLKRYLADYLGRQGYTLRDLDPADAAPADYPHQAKALADAVLHDAGSAGQAALGILICGTGIGMSMAANRVHGIRAALATCEFHARMARMHNNANVLCLGERVTAPGLAGILADIFLSTEFEGERHQRRLDLFN